MKKLNINSKIDIKYSDIPNVCFSLTDKGYKREKEYSKQRKKYGFDDSETWALYLTISKFIIPRLERFLEITDGVILFDNVQKEHMNNLLIALKLLVNDNESDRILSKKEWITINKGLKSFPKIFRSLWW